MDYLKIGLIFILLTVSLAYAGFLDPILDPIENFFKNLTNQVEAELDRTRVGRELNRIIEDVENVAHIVNDIKPIAAVLSSVSPPLAIINLATQYGHEPNDLFNRFKERVDSLETNYAGDGGGPNGELSETEIAAALQTVLEEPQLPIGVYMGDYCIIDLTQCNFLDPSRASSYRDSYFSYSCYVNGVVDKKKVNGLNRATCRATWINTWQGNVVPVQFMHDNQFATYYWDQCAKVYLTTEQQNTFLQNKVCNQPIARHDVGDVCAVDYTGCSANSTALYDSYRVGTVAYDLIPGTVRRSYLCDLPYYGMVALDQHARKSCEIVYVGEREVDELLTAKPEIVAEPIIQEPIVPTTTEGTPPPPIEGLDMTGTRRFPISRLGDLPSYVIPTQTNIVYGKYNALDITPSVYKQKQKAAKSSKQTDMIPTLEDIKSKIKGQKIPNSLMMLFGNENIAFEVRANDGRAFYFCTVISDGTITSFEECKKNDPDFTPTLKISTSQTVLQQMKAGKGIDIFFDAVDHGTADYEGVGLVNKIKYDVMSFVARLGIIST
ncbi:MAG: hypothetical protein ABID61_04380 [Candidatus Micrarchaeota archaeon]